MLLNATAFILALVALTAQAQYTSDRPIRLIVPFAAGSGTDLAARIMGEALAEVVKRPIVIDNRPGAMGTIGIEATAKAAPDGHTLVMSGGSALSSAPHLMKHLPYDPQRDLAPVYFLASSPLGLWVAQNAPYKDFQALLEAARAAPGKLNYGTHVATTLVAMELVKHSIGFEIPYVRYKSAPQGLNDVAAGLLTTMFADLSGSLPLARAGKIRALAVFKRSRAALAPDVPTVYELGYSGHEMFNWTGVFTTAKTPPALVNYLNAEIGKIAARADISERYAKVGLDLHQTASPESLAEFIREESAAVGAVIKRLGIAPE